MTPIEPIVLLLTPFALLGSTYLAFHFLVRLWGPRFGYLAGFLFYWIVWGLLLPWWLVGRAGLAAMFRVPPEPFGEPAWIGVAFLLFPLALGYGYAFPKAVRQVSFQVILFSALIAIVNGTLEEVLWRGTYLQVFPNSWFLGLVYPAFGFAVWHFAPQSIHPNRAPGGNLSLVLIAWMIALLWGYVAKVSGSILLPVISHILFDFSGLGARIYFPKAPRVDSTKVS